MKFLIKYIYKKLREFDANLPQALASPMKSNSLESYGMNFTVYRANGGHIIEHRTYDKRTDRNNNSLHIITDDKDLGEEIGKIITFESIRS